MKRRAANATPEICIYAIVANAIRRRDDFFYVLSDPSIVNDCPAPIGKPTVMELAMTCNNPAAVLALRTAGLEIPSTMIENGQVVATSDFLQQTGREKLREAAQKPLPKQFLVSVRPIIAPTQS